jgi:glycosyltransferase involved in cell wall biosynthesis
MTTTQARWLVVNQSQAPVFQKLLDEVAARLGRCLLYTGMPHDDASKRLIIHRAASYDRRSMFRRGLSWARFLAGAALPLLRSPRATVTFVTTNPPFLPHLAWFASRLRGQRYAVLVWDLYPDHMVKMGWLRERSFIARAWVALNRRAFRDAAVVVTIGERMRRSILKQFGSDASRGQVLVIPNFADTSAIRPFPKEDNPFAQKLKQVGKTTVMYSGNLGATHGTAVIAGAAEVLRYDSRVSFVVAGEGLGRGELEREVARRGLRNVTVLGSQPWSLLPQSLSTADIALVSQARGSEDLSVPSKTYSCLAAGSAILALTDPMSDLGRLVQENEVGLVRPINDAEKVAEAIRQLVNEPARLARFRVNARRLAEREFSVEVAAERFTQALAPAFAAAAESLGEREAMTYQEEVDELGEVILLALKGVAGSGVSGAVAALVTKIGRNRVREAAQRNHVDAMVGVGLRRSGVELGAMWEEAIDHNRRRVEALVATAVAVSARLERAGVACAAFEAGGVLLATDLPMSAYGSGDIDLLVEASRWDRVPAALGAEGFVQVDRRGRPTGRLEFRRRTADGEDEWLEVGFAPFDRSWLPLPVRDRSQTWLGRRERSRKEPRLYVLRPSDSLALVCMHTSLHSYVRAPGIRLHTDVDRLIRDTSVDWDSYVEEVLASGFARRAFVSLAMARGLLATPVPDSVLERLHPGKPWASIRRLLSTEGVIADGRPKLRRARAVLLDALLDERGRIRWLADLVVPPEDWMRAHFDRKRGGAPLWRLHARRLFDVVTKWKPE